MIESLHSLGKNPLPAITTLNLRSNRLTSLAGIQRLLSLERVDLRDNKLTDPTELARLTAIPDIQEIYVQRNSFCKTHGNYRVTIFNLFRATPGYSEDIVIDSTGPGYSERKQLVERAPELPNVPVMKPPLEDDMPPPPPPKVHSLGGDGAGPEPDEPVPLVKPASSHHRSRSDYGTGSHRRRKGPKRRIVELTQNESLHPTQAATHESSLQPRFIEPPASDDVYGNPTTTPTRKQSAPVSTTTPLGEQEQLPLLDTALGSPTNPAALNIPSNPPPEFDVSSDLYRKKIEALRNDFGSNWLSALGDETWDSKRNGSFPEQDFSPPLRPTVPRTSSQGIVSGGRTLG